MLTRFSTVLSTLLACAILSIPTLAVERTLVAEGSYTGQKSNARKPYDAWKLWKESDGSFSAEVVAGPAAGIAGRLVQTFRFDNQFLPSGYSLNLARVREGDTISLSCRLETDRLSCESEFEGKKSSTSTDVKGPCIVMIDDFSGIDLVWLSVAATRIFQANKFRGSVDVYVLKEKSLGQISLEMDSHPDKFVMAGVEPAAVLGKSRTIRKYEFGGEELWEVKALSNGLIVSMSVKGAPDAGFELAEYNEYSEWAP
jgi:hypothetical protein